LHGFNSLQLPARTYFSEREKVEGKDEILSQKVGGEIGLGRESVVISPSTKKNNAFNKGLLNHFTSRRTLHYASLPPFTVFIASQSQALFSFYFYGYGQKSPSLSLSNYLESFCRHYSSLGASLFMKLMKLHTHLLDI
jgi:hypothetical protein